MLKSSHLAASLSFFIGITSLLLLIPSYSLAKDKWIRIQSRNFTLVGNESEREIQKTAIHLEQFREAVMQLLPQVRINSSVPTTVIVFKNHGSYRPFKPQYKGKTRDNVAGYFLASSDKNYITLTLDSRLDNPYQVIFHEYFHFLVRNNLLDAPLWLNEGLAEIYSTFEVDSNGRKFRIGLPIATYLMILNRYSQLPLKTLLAVEHSSPEYNDSSKTKIFYSQSWALVHYLMLGNKSARHPQLKQFINRLNTGLSIEENFHQSFQTDYKKMEGELRSYTSRSSYPILEATLLKPLELDKELRSVPLSDAEASYYLGDLLLCESHLDEAETYLEKSFKLDPNLVDSQISLAILRAKQQRFDEARVLLQAVIAAYPQNHLGCFYYAESLSQDGHYEEAIKYYKQALAIKPDMANAHAELGFTYLSLGQEDDAQEEFKRARQLAPLDQDYYYSRSFNYLSLGYGKLAVAAALQALNLSGWQSVSAMYMLLTAHLGYRQEHKDAEAKSIFERAVRRENPTQWPYPVIRYLRQEITAQELLAQATDNDKQTEAHTYLGLDLSISGRREEALEHLRWVKENGNKRFYEYPVALAELDRLERNTRKSDL